MRRKAWIVKVHDMIPDPNTLRSPLYERIFWNGCYGVFLNLIGKKADKVWVLTRELKNLLTNKGYSPKSVTVIPHGVDVDVFYPSSLDEIASKRTILYIGSMTPDDGLEHLIKAFFLLNQNESNLLMIGDGPQRSQLIELVRKLNLEGNVTFYRYIRHELMPEFIRKAYVTVGPLRLSPINYYTIPTKILEYFASGKPVVSSPVSKDILIDGLNGLVVKKVTPKNILEKLSILMEDEKLATEMGKNARQLVVKSFRWETAINRIEKEIRDLEPRRSS